MKNNGIIDKILRVITLPALVTAITVAILSYTCKAMTQSEMLLSLLFLCVVPLTSYPMSTLTSTRAERRKKQRSAAFVFSIAGYLAGFIWALAADASRAVKALFAAYLASVVILILLNALCHFKASGHACSATAPCVFLTWQLGWAVVAPCLLLLAAVYVSSVRLRRHTLPQLMVGSFVSLAAGIASILLF